MRIVFRVGRPNPPPQASNIVPRYAEPRLLVQWSPRFSGILENLVVALLPCRAPAYPLAGTSFPLPPARVSRGSVGTSALLHVAMILILVNAPTLFAWLPAPQPRRNATIIVADYNIQWYRNSQELPNIADEGGGEKRSEKGGERKGPSRLGASQLTGQVIVSNPPNPDNDRQTIVQPDAPDIKLNEDVRVPNIVMWAHQPRRPGRDFLPPAEVRLQAENRLPREMMQVNRERPALELLPAPDIRLNPAPRLVVPSDIVRPDPPVDLVKRDVARLRAPRLGVPEVEPPAPEPPILEDRVSSMRLSSAAALAREPSLAAPPSTTARVTGGEGGDGPADAPPAPPIPLAAGASSNLGRLIAVGVDPAPAGGRISVPAGNRSGSFSTGPEGRVPGTPYGKLSGLERAGAIGPAPAGEGSGEGPGAGPGADTGRREVADIRVPGLSISGGVRPPSPSTGPVVSGARNPLPEPPRAPSSGSRPPRNEQLAALMANATRPQIPLPDWNGRGGRRDDHVFSAGKKIYTAYINMPNLGSQAGSWVLRFTDLAERPPGTADDELSAPVAVRKVDPAYDPNILREGVTGVVLLYAVIREDGSVDGVRVLKGLDPRLDENSMKALRRWQFQPGTRKGQAVALEAVIQIPFAIARQPF